MASSRIRRGKFNVLKAGMDSPPLKNGTTSLQKPSRSFKLRQSFRETHDPAEYDGKGEMAPKRRDQKRKKDNRALRT
jgi:hypothetical protein